jgi:hypothetical protein
MQQIKLFKSIESELEDLQEDVNAWIKESGARVISVTGNIAPQTPHGGGPMNTFASSDVLVIVTYEV